MNRRWWWLGASVAVVVVVALLVATHRSSPSVAETPAPAAAPDVPLVGANWGPFTAHIQAPGRVGAPAGGEARLAFANAGVLARIDVHVGEAVVAGQALAELDTGGLALDLAAARSDAAAAAASYGGGSVPAQAVTSAAARLSAARDRLRAVIAGTGSAQSDRAAARAAVVQSEGKLAADRRALERETALFAGGVAARKDVEAAREQLQYDEADAAANRARAASAGAGIGAALTQARADVAQADSDLRAAQAQRTVSGAQASSARARYEAAARTLALATLRAPSAGVVTAILKHAGEAADPTQAALVVGPPSASTVTLTVGGDDAREVRAGDRVMLRVAGRDGATPGQVRYVVPSVDPTTQTSTIVVSGVPPGALPGDAVEASIAVGERHGILIPTSAIVEDPQTGKALVFVRQRAPDGSEKFSAREIVVAAGDETTSLVAAGLRGGERVAAQGAFDLLAPSGGGG